ncbi:MAG: pirin family protein [Bacteroidetes bacterium]|nr:pirin family protein [Bacteroidota bacterium]HET6243005.1 pirin family protein [Bacteroidia bacterium]
MNHQHQYTIEKLKKTKSVEMSHEKGIWGKRLFPSNFMRGFDPFVLLDEFFVEPPGELPTQINQGFECLTYVLDGNFEFKDHNGNTRTISDGGLQRFTAPKGVQNSFRPVSNGVNHGLRLWIKLPSEMHGSEISFQYLEAKDIPYEENATKLIRKIAGKKCPLMLHGNIQFDDVTLAKKAFHKFTFSEKSRCFIYVITGINGSIRINDIIIEPGEGIFFENLHDLTVICREKACRFIFVSGMPYGEPIKVKGGIVE